MGTSIAVDVVIEGVSEAACPTNGVGFEAGQGGAATPGTVAGKWNASPPRCMVATSWTLGPAPGAQALEAHLLGSGRKLTIDAAAIPPYRLVKRAGDGQRGWHNRVLGDSLLVEIQTAAGGALDLAKCQTLTVTFTPYLKSEAGPTPAPALWGAASSRCRAEARWKVAAVSGAQRLVAVAKVGDKPASQPAEFRATVRAPPSVSSGVAFLLDPRELDSLTVTRKMFEANGNTAVGGDLILGLNVPSPLDFILPREHWRGFLGVSINEPTRQVFGGLYLLPLIRPEWDDFPGQVIIGGRLQRITVRDCRSVRRGADGEFVRDEAGEFVAGDLASSCSTVERKVQQEDFEVGGELVPFIDRGSDTRRNVKFFVAVTVDVLNLLSKIPIF